MISPTTLIGYHASAQTTTICLSVSWSLQDGGGVQEGKKRKDKDEGNGKAAMSTDAQKIL